MAASEGGGKHLESITVDVIGAHLCAIAEEMGEVLVRASYSTNIKERRDCSAALLDPEGNTLAQAEHIPLHLGSMLNAVKALRESHEELRPGDVFIGNDPYVAASTHLPDITVCAPLFDGQGLAGFSVTVAHHAEVGGNRAPATDVFDEGLRIPQVKVISEGEVERDILDLILLNCRMPIERRGDLRAQFAAVRLGERRFAELVGKYGSNQVRHACEAWMDKAELQIKAALTELPNGEYEFVDYMDDDGFGNEDLAIRVKLTLDGERVHLDFTGTHPQVSGAINVVRPALLATAYYAVKLVLDPTLPANSGFFRVIEVDCPTGSLVNPDPPAPVLLRSDTCQRAVDVILGAFAQAVPDRVPAASNGAITGVEFSGNAPRNGEFSYIETLGGGAGAGPENDGASGIHTHMTNTSNLPVEVLENEYPLRIRRYALREGSGGDGRRQGGMGLVREIEVTCDGVFFRSKGDRTKRQPWGLNGGGPGATARFILNPGQEDESELGSKVAGYVLNRGDAVRVETAGGGGYGPPECAVADPASEIERAW